MPRAVLQRNSTLSSQDALNAIATGVAGMRTTDVFVNDLKGTTLSLSDTNASKAVPLGTRVITFWSDVDFRCRLNTTAATTDGAYVDASDVVTVTIDPDDSSPVTSVQAILASGVGTLYLNFAFGT